MPSYVYRSSCGFEMELTHSITIDPTPSCPVCPDKMKRVPQSAQVKFKGEGFYSTDKKK